MDITFNCDKCGQSIVIEEAGAGLLVQCPKCGQSLRVPSVTAQRTPHAPAEPSPTNQVEVTKAKQTSAARWVILALLIPAIIVGFFIFWYSQKVAPVKAAARAVIEQSYDIEAALKVGLSKQEHRGKVAELAIRVEKLKRVANPSRRYDAALCDKAFYVLLYHQSALAAPTSSFLDDQLFRADVMTATMESLCQ